MINYCRTLIPTECKSCGYSAYDTDFEKYQIKSAGHGYFDISIHMICPNCKEVNCHEFLNSENTEGVSDGLEESGVLHDVSHCNTSDESHDISEPSVEGALASTTHDENSDTDIAYFNSGNWYCKTCHSHLQK